MDSGGRLKEERNEEEGTATNAFANCCNVDSKHNIKHTISRSLEDIIIGVLGGSNEL